MNGKVTRLRPRGVEAEMDAPVDTLTADDRFEVYRMNGDAEVLVGTFYPKRSKGPNTINLNRVDGTDASVEAQLDDLVRQI